MLCASIIFCANALCLAQLNEEEDNALLEGQPGVGVNYGELDMGPYGGGYEFEDGDVDAAEVEGFAAERAMQQGVQNSVVQFMSNALGQSAVGSSSSGGAASARASSTPPAAPSVPSVLPPRPSPHDSGKGAPNMSAHSSPGAGKNVLVNPITRKTHTMSGGDSSASPATDSDVGKEEWQCTACGGINVGCSSARSVSGVSACATCGNAR
jgi:hypothetical protein